MKKLNVTWDGVFDSTGYLFSFAKSLSCAVKNSPFPELAEDIVASSGFAFRMWVSPDLCPSATSIWQFDLQKSGAENGGLRCSYIERLWGQEDMEETRRQEALALIRQSINTGIPAVSWDIGVCEWGLIIGYDDETEKLAVLPITGQEGENAELACSWNLEYFLGTYGPLKWYAWKFLERHGSQELASLYQSVYENWQKAFEMKKSLDMTAQKNRQAMAELLRQAEAKERQAVDRM